MGWHISGKKKPQKKNTKHLKILHFRMHWQLKVAFYVRVCGEMMYFSGYWIKLFHVWFCCFTAFWTLFFKAWVPMNLKSLVLYLFVANWIITYNYSLYNMCMCEWLMGDSSVPILHRYFLKLVLGHRSCHFQEDSMSEETWRTHSIQIIQLWLFSRALEICVQSAFAKGLWHIFRKFSEY